VHRRQETGAPAASKAKMHIVAFDIQKNFNSGRPPGEIKATKRIVAFIPPAHFILIYAEVSVIT